MATCNQLLVLLAISVSVGLLPWTVSAQDQTQIVIRPQQLTQVNVGSSVTLACVAYGNPIPTISWNKGSSRLTNSSEVTIYQQVLNISGITLTKSILEICTPGVNDAGQYSCYAEDSAPANFEVMINQATASATTELSTTDEGLSNGQIIAITFGTLTLIVTIVGSIIVPVCIDYHKKKNKNKPGG